MKYKTIASLLIGIIVIITLIGYIQPDTRIKDQQLKTLHGPEEYNTTQITNNIYRYNLSVDHPNTICSVETVNKYTLSENDKIYLSDNSDCSKKSLKDVVKFLLNDTTITNRYIRGEYDCSQFSQDLVNNATNNGILAFPVIIKFGNVDTEHAITTFPTTDKGLVYIDGTGYSNHKCSPINYKIVTNLTKGQDLGTTELWSSELPLPN